MTLTFSDMLAIAPKTQRATPDNDTKRHPNTAGQRYLDRIAEGMDPNEALIMARNEGISSAIRRCTIRPDTLNRKYTGENRDTFATDVGGMLVERILSALAGIPYRGGRSPEQVAKITVSSCVGRVDRANNKATRYWACRYSVRFNFTLTPTVQWLRDRAGTTLGGPVPTIGEWLSVTKEQYLTARKQATHHLAGWHTDSGDTIPWVEVYEYRYTPRTLSDNDHDSDSGYTTKMGDTKVWATIQSLPDAERTALRLYGMGSPLRIIADALFGKDQGTTEQARNIVRSALRTVRVRVEGTRDDTVSIVNRPCPEQAPNFRFGKRKDSVRCYYNGTEQPTTEQIPSIRPAVSSPTTWGEQMANTHGRINRRKIAATIKYMAQYPNGKAATPV